MNEAERAWHEGPPPTPVETFIDEVLYPAFNECDEVEVIDPVFGGGAVDFCMTDGKTFRVTIEELS